MIRRLFAATIALAMLAGAAHADLGSGIRVRPANLTGPLVAGTPTAIDFAIDADHATTLTALHMTSHLGTVGAGLSVGGLPASLAIVPGTASVLHLTLTAPDENTTVKFQFDADGHTWTEYFDLSRRHYDQMHRPQQAVSVAAAPAYPIAPGADDDPGAGPPVNTALHTRPIRDLRNLPAGARSTEAHTVHVTGRVVYYRTGNSNVVYKTPGADHVRVRVFDQNTFSDDLLYEGRTDSDGNFDWNVVADESKPDLYVEIATINGAVNVQDDVWNSVWSFESSVHEDYAGSSLAFGTLEPEDLYMDIAIHMHNTVTRTWRWWHSHTNIPIALQAVEFPSGDWAHYDRFGGDLHIPENIGGVKNLSQAWAEGTLSHEYGHAIMGEAIGYSPGGSYDNGICNNPNGDPGHCVWCQEDGGVAVSEGWANWVADMTTRDFASLYGLAALSGLGTESLRQCTQNGPAYYADAWTTEGNFGALLRDLSDFDDEADPGAAPYGADRLHYDVGPIVAVVNSYQPHTPADFLQWFRPNHLDASNSDWWQTLANSGYVLADNTAPSAVSSLSSFDHAINVPTPDATITILWLPATDDMSGVDHYEAQYATSIFGPWTQITVQVPNSNTFTSSIPKTFVITTPLPVGSYEVRVRAVDRAGHAGPYTANGPYVIRAPLPADFGPATLAGWTSHIVPRDATGATSTNCTVATLLPPNSPGTFLNYSVSNIGESAASAVSRTRVLLDGVQIDSVGVGSVGAHSSLVALNRPGFTVRGGLHTLEARYDDDEVLAEPNENNNDNSVQYNWLAQPVSMNSRVRRAAPPAPYGGFSGLPFFGANYVNCDGLSYTQFRILPTQNFPFAGMWAASLDTTEDVNLSLHTHSSSTSDGGFRTRLAFSSRPAGQLDAVLSSTRNLSASLYDVGVVNANLGTHDYLAGAVAAPGTALVAGDSAVITMPDSVMMALRDLNLTSTAPQAVDVQITSGTGPVYALWLSNTFVTGTLSTFDGKVATDAAGHASLTIVPAATGIHELVFYRNPNTGWAGVTIKVRIVPLKSDMSPGVIAGWAGSLVPRPAADATTTLAPAPAALTGDAASTWLNTSLTNSSPAAAGFVNVFRSLDQTALGNQLFLLAGSQTLAAVNGGPVQAPAGRHVLSMSIDPTNLIPEIDETNNRTGRQWVWTPPVAPLATPLWRAGTNGGPLEGWDVVDSTQTPSFDVDGLRTPVFSNAITRDWVAVAVTPRPGSDVDAELFEKSTGASNGFSDPLAFSSWDGDATELLLVNFGATPYRGFDVGVLRAAQDTASYSAEIVTSAARPIGISGPFTLGAEHLVQLHVIDFPAGHHTVDVVNQVGDVDWGAAAYTGPRPYQNRSDGADVATAWAAPAGGSEHLEFDVPVAGRYAVAVFKAGASERAKTGTYALAVDRAWAGIEPAAAETKLMGASPTPFSARTELGWALATDGDAELAIYDVRGARVRTLVKGRSSAGRHHVSWSGDDDAGRPLAPGLYFVRLVTAERRDVARVVLAR